MSATHVVPARTVFDPAIPAAELRILRAAARAMVIVPLRHLDHPADRVVVAYLLAGMGAVAAQAAVPGAPWTWAWFLAATGLLASVAAAAGRCAAARYRGRLVSPARLDPAARQLLAGAQAAINDVLGSRVFRDGILDAPAVAAVLAASEWELARMLGEACRLAAARDGILDGLPAAGPQHEALVRGRCHVHVPSSRLLLQR
jgi:hypothetical protein